jgi:hypothetical protein
MSGERPNMAHTSHEEAIHVRSRLDSAPTWHLEDSRDHILAFGTQVIVDGFGIGV